MLTHTGVSEEENPQPHRVMGLGFLQLPWGCLWENLCIHLESEIEGFVFLLLLYLPSGKRQQKKP